MEFGIASQDRAVLLQIVLGYSPVIYPVSEASVPNKLPSPNRLIEFGELDWATF
jgi:hypothetical protein